MLHHGSHRASLCCCAVSQLGAGTRVDLSGLDPLCVASTIQSCCFGRVSFSRQACMPATSQVPDQLGRFGDYGGRFVPETLMRALDELAAAYDVACRDSAFQSELD